MFDLSKLDFTPIYGENFTPPSTENQLSELESHFGHKLPDKYKEILQKYNGCRPGSKKNHDELKSSISYFYSLSENKAFPGCIWKAIANCSLYIGADSLPIAEKSSEDGVFFLKFIDGKTQVWMFQYGDFVDEDVETNINGIPYDLFLVTESFDELLESLL